MKHIDTERVIAAVHRRPLLWKRRHELYKEKEARENAWQEVSNEVMPDYKSLCAIEQQAAEKRIQQRWRTARDTYIKVKFAEESQPPGSKKKYAYYDTLSFLDGAGRRVKRQHYQPNDDSSIEESLTVRNSARSSLTSTPPPQKPEKTRTRTKKETKIVQSSELELEKEDLAFFQSLQPTLKRFNNYQKMMLRTKILQIIMEMESPMIHEVEVASSPGVAITNDARTVQSDPMSYTVIIKSEIEPDGGSVIDEQSD